LNVFAGLSVQIWASQGYDLAVVARMAGGHASEGLRPAVTADAKKTR